MQQRINSIDVQNSKSEDDNASDMCEVPKSTSKGNTVVDRYIREEIEKRGLQSIEEATDPITMDIWTVIQMMEEFKLEIKAEITEQLQRIQPVTGDQSSTMKMATLSAKIEVCEAKNCMVIDAMAGMSDKIDGLATKLDLKDVDQAKKQLIVAGLETHQKKYIARRQLEDFFEEQVCVTAQIEDFYYIGRSQLRRYSCDPKFCE